MHICTIAGGMVVYFKFCTCEQHPTHFKRAKDLTVNTTSTTLSRLQAMTAD